MKFRHCVILSLTAALLAACNDSEEEVAGPEAARPAPIITPAPTPTAAPDGTALVAGAWNVSEDAGGARAVYGEAGAAAALTLACDRMGGELTMELASAAQAPEAWRLDAGGEAARIDMNPVDGGLSAAIAPGLAIFHAFSTPGQVVVLTSPSGERMQFPTHPGISRVVEACS